MAIILITGGSGLIGMQVSEKLEAIGHTVRHLSRSVTGDEKYATFQWDLNAVTMDEKALDGVDHIIHLAGENVGDGTWTKARKERILSSRVKSAALIREKLGTQRITSYISASGSSYYGTVTEEQIFSEEDPAGSDFLANVCVEWEKAADSFTSIANRIVILRTSVVLSEQGGALERMAKPARWGLGAALGSGKQYMPWIHEEDMANLYVFVIQQEEIKGIYNAVAPEHCTNKEMTKKIGKALDKKTWLPNVPGFLLKLVFGEMAQIILKGSRLSGEKIQKAGFTFRHPEVQEALNDLLSKKNRP